MPLLDDRALRPVFAVIARSRKEPTAEPELQELSRFLGMVVTMRYELDAPPQFCVRYGECRARVALDSMRLLDGYLSPRAYGLICEWSAVHRSELIKNWWRLREGRTPIPVEPLD